MAQEPEQPPLRALAQDVYKAALDLRTAVEDYESKKFGGRDPKDLFPEKTDQQVIDALKLRVRPAMQNLRQTRTALATRLKAEVDDQIA